jgi:apolipoprotein N-acyltransferase
MNGSRALLSGTADRISDRLAMLRERLARVVGWRRAAVAFGCGALATAALPPVYAVVLAFPAFSGLLWLIDTTAPSRDGARAAFLTAWWFAFGHFLFGFYWLANALLVDAAQYGWMIPFALFGLAGGLALFPATAVTIYHRLGVRGVGGVLIFAVLWTAAEWLRGHVLTGFPWNLIGTIWADSPTVMQAASVFGIYGLSLFTVIVTALPATLAERSGPAPLGRWTGTAAAAVLLIVTWGAGAARLSNAAPTMVPDVRLRLVQPNVPQTLKWDPEARVANFRKGLELTRSPGFDTRTHVIWSETAVPFVLTDFSREGAALRDALASVTPPDGLLITGSLRAARGPDGQTQLWNSLFVLDPAGRILETYDKHHLVPFGEYVPLHSLLAFAKITPGTIDFSAGPGPQTLEPPGLPPTSPLICYEAIFPGEVVDRSERPGWLLNVSNDAWFGLSAGPHQHFASARFRAVEEGLPLVRATNDGISAVVDGYGRVVAELGLGLTGVLDAPLPTALPPTPYARFGDWLVFTLGALCAAAALMLHRLR